MNYLSVTISSLFEDNLHRTNVAAFFGRVLDFLFKAYATYAYSPFKVIWLVLKNVFVIWAYYLTVAFIESMFFKTPAKNKVIEPKHDGYCVVESLAGAFSVTPNRVLTDLREGHLDVLLDKLFKTYTFAQETGDLVAEVKRKAADQLHHYPGPLPRVAEFSVLESVLLCSIVRSIRLNVLMGGLMYTYNPQGKIDLQLVIGSEGAHMRRGGLNGQSMRLGELLHRIDPALPTGSRWYQAYTDRFLHHFAYRPMTRPSRFIGLDGELLKKPSNKKERCWYRQDFMHYWINCCHTFDVCTSITLKELKTAFHQLTGETLPTVGIVVPARRIHGVDYPKKTLVRYERETRTFPSDKSMYEMLTTRRDPVELALMYFTRPCYAMLKVMSPEEIMTVVHIVAHSRTQWNFDFFKENRHTITVGNFLATVEADFKSQPGPKTLDPYRNLIMARAVMKHGRIANTFFMSTFFSLNMAKQIAKGSYDLDQAIELYRAKHPEFEGRDTPPEVAEIIERLRPKPMQDDPALKEESSPGAGDDGSDSDSDDDGSSDSDSDESNSNSSSAKEMVEVRTSGTQTQEPCTETPEAEKEADTVDAPYARVKPMITAPDDKAVDCRSINRRAHERKVALQDNGVLVYVRDAMITRLAGIPISGGALNAAFNTYSSHLNLDDGTLNKFRSKTIEAARKRLRQLESEQMMDALKDWDLSRAAEGASAILPASIRNLLNVFSTFSGIWTGELRQSILDKIGAYGAAVSEYVSAKGYKGEESTPRCASTSDRGMPHSSTQPPRSAEMHCTPQTEVHRLSVDATQAHQPLSPPASSPGSQAESQAASRTPVAGRSSQGRTREDERYSPTPLLDSLRPKRPAYAPFWDDQQTNQEEPHSLSCCLKLLARICYSLITRTQFQRRRGDIRGAASGGLLVLLLVVIN